MKVKNYLVLKNYMITERFFLYYDMPLVESRYKRMEEILVESAQLYLQDCDEIIVDRHTVSNDQEMFKHHMQVLMDRYHSEPCNILYCDLDMVFVKPYTIFGEFSTFAMLSGNCGVRYYPHGGVSEEIWNIQKQRSLDWDTSINDQHEFAWHHEQDIYNEMINHVIFVERDGDMTTPFAPNVHNVHNSPYEGAGLIHCCGTSQRFDSIVLMEELLGLSKLQDHDKIKKLLECDLYGSIRPVTNNANPWM